MSTKSTRDKYRIRGLILQHLAALARQAGPQQHTKAVVDLLDELWLAEPFITPPPPVRRFAATCLHCGKPAEVVEAADVPLPEHALRARARALLADIDRSTYRSGSDVVSGFVGHRVTSIETLDALRGALEG